jgi:predicted PurR-regulated permease PerM
VPILGLILAIAVLYFAQELLIPLAFALLLAFLLSPMVKRVEEWGIPRGAAAGLVLFVAGALLAIVGWLALGQMMQVGARLRDDAQNIQRKIAALQGHSNSLNDAISALEDLGVQINNSKPPGEQAPMKVEIVAQHNMMQAIRENAGSVLKPLGRAGLVLIFTLFMLIDRENLRNRLLRLMGEQNLQATTKAMDDAGRRVSRYVLLQFTVNAGFGAVIALGLWLLRVPSPLLWGALGMMLRFLPYIGSIVAALLPFAVAVAESDGWRTPLSVLALFVVTEAIVGNIVEPLLYGVNTGLSAVALLVSAVFWTVIWGPVGLVLSTPLTVCLSVLGKHSPQFEFLNVVLGDEPVLTPAVIFYQRLLALDQHDAMNMLESLGRNDCDSRAGVGGTRQADRAVGCKARGFHRADHQRICVGVDGGRRFVEGGAGNAAYAGVLHTGTDYGRRDCRGDVRAFSVAAGLSGDSFPRNGFAGRIDRERGVPVGRRGLYFCGASVRGGECTEGGQEHWGRCEFANADCGIVELRAPQRSSNAETGEVAFGFGGYKSGGGGGKGSGGRCAVGWGN